MDKKISQLTELSIAKDNDVMLILDSADPGNATKKITSKNFKRSYLDKTFLGSPILINQILTSTIPSDINNFITFGYDVVDSSAVTSWKNITTPRIQRAWHKISADGRWWQMTNSQFTPQMFGAKADSSTDDTAALTNFFNACVVLGGDGYIPSGYYRVAGQLVWDIGKKFDYSSIVRSGTITSGSNVVTIDSSYLLYGMSVTGNGIPNGSIINSVNDSTHITLSNPATLTGTVSITFSIAGSSVCPRIKGAGENLTTFLFDQSVASPCFHVTDVTGWFPVGATQRNAFYGEISGFTVETVCAHGIGLLIGNDAGDTPMYFNGTRFGPLVVANRALTFDSIATYTSGLVTCWCFITSGGGGVPASHGGGAAIVISGTTVNGSAIVTIASSSLLAGMSVTGNGIPNGSIINSVNDSTHITLSNPATVTGTTSITFSGFFGIAHKLRNCSMTGFNGSSGNAAIGTYVIGSVPNDAFFGNTWYNYDWEVLGTCFKVDSIYFSGSGIGGVNHIIGGTTTLCDYVFDVTNGYGLVAEDHLIGDVRLSIIKDFDSNTQGTYGGHGLVLRRTNSNIIGQVRCGGFWDTRPLTPPGNGSTVAVQPTLINNSWIKNRWGQGAFVYIKSNNSDSSLLIKKRYWNDYDTSGHEIGWGPFKTMTLNLKPGESVYVSTSSSSPTWYWEPSE